MSEEKKQSTTENSSPTIEEVIERGENITAEVRDITIEMLRQHHLNFEHIKSVIKTILTRTQVALEHRSDIRKDTLEEVIKGLDQALEKSAYASKLAIEETAGRVKDFGEHDMKRALDDLAGLEEMFIESLSEAAEGSKTMTHDVLYDLIEHLKNTGTEVGRRAGEETASLMQLIEKAGEENITAMGEATRTFTEDIARAASGFLAGIADSVKDAKEETQPPAEKDR